MRHSKCRNFAYPIGDQCYMKLTAEEMKELAALEDRGGKSRIDDTN